MAVALKALAGLCPIQGITIGERRRSGPRLAAGLVRGPVQAVLRGLVANQLLCLFQDTVAAMIAERIFLLRSDIGAGQA